MKIERIKLTQEYVENLEAKLGENIPTDDRPKKFNKYKKEG